VIRPWRFFLPAWLGVAACGPAVDEREPSFPYIVDAILRPNCATASCHSTLAVAGGIELDAPATAWTFLLGPDGTGDYVVPGDPTASRLLYLLRAEDAPRMPPDAPLPAVDIALIEAWILEGAKPE
jgi:hypothetical protein